MFCDALRSVEAREDFDEITLRIIKMSSFFENDYAKKHSEMYPKNSKIFSYLKTLALVESLHKHKEGKMHSQYYNLTKIQKTSE